MRYNNPRYLGILTDTGGPNDMKIEFQTNKYEITLQTRSARIHSLLSDNPEMVEKLKATIAAVLDNFDYVVTKDTSTT